MASPVTAKPAPAAAGNPASKNEQCFAGQLYLVNNPERLQVARLLRSFAVSAATAGALAPLVYGEVAR